MNALLHKNQQYLFKEDEILGIHRNLIVEQVNKLEETHSCDVLTMKLDEQITKNGNLFW